MRCSSNQRVTAGLLLSFLTFLPATSAIQAPLDLQQPIIPTVQPEDHTFTLRHIFHRGAYKYPNLHRRLDIHPDDEFHVAYDYESPEEAAPPRLHAKSAGMHIERLADRRHEKIAEHLDYASINGIPRVLESEHWVTDEVPAPNTTDKDTVINLAIMAANAYVPKYRTGNWEDVFQGFNLSVDFGWEGDGLRGHIFADEGNKTIVVGIKGTSMAVFDGDGTTTGDKTNDNLFFSCCCGQGGSWLWREVCDCQTTTYTCNNTCLTKNLKEKTMYYSAALDLYTNITQLYPNSNVWLVGHSLGGAVASMVGLTFGIPVVTFESPGEALAVKRLGLPVPKHANPNKPFQQKLTGTTHFGHTADPIFMGSCNGAMSFCSIGGYAMESQCHTGTICVYDTVGDLNWRVNLLEHRVHEVIDNVIKKYDKVAPCVPDSECIDCFNWKFFKSNGSEGGPTTTATTTTNTWTQTRSEICRTPGWFGCLDKTTTPVVTTTYTTTSCAEPGWFGCNKEVSVTVTTTTAAPTSTMTTTAPSIATSIYTTTSCIEPGWFGCDEETTIIVTTTTQALPPNIGTTSCEDPGFFWGCYDDRKSHTRVATSTVTVPARTTSPTPSPTKIPTPTPTSALEDPGKHKHKHGKKRCKFLGMFCD